MKVPTKLVSAFRSRSAFLLAAHINPDGDSLGSCLALAEGLESLGKKVLIYSREGAPEFYRFMPGHKKIKSGIGKMPDKDTLLVLLDCNSPERAGLERQPCNASAVIDHHETESLFGDIRWIDRGAAATGLMVFHLLRALKIVVTKSMAVNLYTAMAVDTGSFRYSNTSPDVLRVAAELVEAGASPGMIAEHLYERWGKNRFDLLNLSLGTLEIRDRIAVMYITRDMFLKTGTAEADTENFANVPRTLDIVRISVLVREVDEGLWKVSMRSKGQANVAKIAEAHGGGGHRNAAGFKIKADFLSVIKTIFSEGGKVLAIK
jgi:phosphoesterase RecJ-like protein